MFLPINSFIKAQAKKVVQPPFNESVSSTPIQIFTHPINIYMKCFFSFGHK